MSNEDLVVLVDILTFDPKDNKTRINESLTKTKGWNLYYPNDVKALLPDIEKELSRYAGNTLVNVLRGHGVSYRKMLCDVCDKLGIKYNEVMSTKVIENCLLQSRMIDYLDKIDNTKLEELFAEEFNFSSQNNSQTLRKYLKEKLSDMDDAIIKKMCLILFASIVNEWEGKKIDLNEVLRTLFPHLEMVMPPVILWPQLYRYFIESAIEATTNIFGTDYRVTIPVTLYISCLRRIR